LRSAGCPVVRGCARAILRTRNIPEGSQRSRGRRRTGGARFRGCNRRGASSWLAHPATNARRATARACHAHAMHMHHAWDGMGRDGVKTCEARWPCSRAEPSAPHDSTTIAPSQRNATQRNATQRNAQRNTTNATEHHQRNATNGTTNATQRKNHRNPTHARIHGCMGNQQRSLRMHARMHGCMDGVLVSESSLK
jgi:hypothetical protein